MLKAIGCFIASLVSLAATWFVSLAFVLKMTWLGGASIVSGIFLAFACYTFGYEIIKSRRH